MPSRQQRRSLAQAQTRVIRPQVFERERRLCRLCGMNAATMHEISGAGATGSRLLATTLSNSIAVCGDGVAGCHGLLQRHIVRVRRPIDAQKILTFGVSPADYEKYRGVFARRALSPHARLWSVVIVVHEPFLKCDWV